MASFIFKTDTANLFNENICIGYRRVTFYPSSLSTNETNVFIAHSLEHGEECIMSKYRLKKDANELQEYLQFRRRGSRVDA